MRKRDLRLEEYGISRARYRELYNFSLQYPSWREELEHEVHTVASPPLDGMPKGTSIGDATASLAIRRTILQEKCGIVETALAEAGMDMVQYLYASVCLGKPLSYLHGTMQMPCERDAFYDMRRYYFYVLNNLKI